jgi:CPA2 family monovalent cation:H+ antiporter-2
MESGFLSLLGPFTVLLGVSVAILLLSERFRMPPVAGLLLTGTMIGPHGLSWIPDRATVEQFAELGCCFFFSPSVLS